MLLIGKKQRLKAIRFAPEGVFLDDGAEGVLLPRKQVPAGLRTDDEVEVFIYNDGDGAIMATAMEPKGVLDDIVALEVINVTPNGAYLQLGIPKDVFLHKSQIRNIAEPGDIKVVKLILDYDGRLAATELIESWLDNAE